MVETGNKIDNITGLVTKSINNSSVTEIENKIPNSTSLVTKNRFLWNSCRKKQKKPLI